MIKDDLLVVLASASPRRKELLAQMGIRSFHVYPAKGDEAVTSEDPVDTVHELSLQKAREVYDELSPQEEKLLVIGADTVVVPEQGGILGKPADREDAVRMLTMLSGHTHRVYTGVTLICSKLPSPVTFHAETKVTVAKMSEDEIRTYVDTGETDDKAGSYGVQGIFCRHITHIDGEYANVVGLPVAMLYRVLKENRIYI